MSTVKQMENGDISDLVVWGGDDPFTHTLVLGPTRCGKTSTILEPLIFELLKAKKRGQKCGFTIIEPKGDVARMVRDMAIDMGLEDELVYVDPLYPDETDRINVMKGDKNDVTEATVAVLKSLFGKQDAFFATVQELSSRKVTLLLKELYENNMDILDVLANLRDESLLKRNVEKYRAKYGTTDLVQFFDNELLGSGQMADKYRQFIVGLRSQLENITSNEYLRAIVTGKSDIDLDEHLENGGILAVNTALGRLGKSGDAFGMFIAMHMQLATFRRPGTERTRIPHYLIIDEYSRYINPDTERFLSIAASYRVALIAAIQSLSQLELESGTLSAKAMKNAILTSTRNKIVFGGLEYEDANEVSKIMGSDKIVERVRKYDGGILQNILPKMYEDVENEKPRFSPTLLMDGLPRFHCIAKLLKDGTPQEPFVAKGEWVPKDWKEQILAEEEATSVLNRSKPPFWKLKDRAFYNVEMFELENAQKLREERRKKLLESNPFEDLKAPLDDKPLVTVPVEKIQLTNLKENAPVKPLVKEKPTFSFNLQENIDKTEVLVDAENIAEQLDITEIQAPEPSLEAQSENKFVDVNVPIKSESVEMNKDITTNTDIKQRSNETSENIPLVTVEKEDIEIKKTTNTKKRGSFFFPD